MKQDVSTRPEKKWVDKSEEFSFNKKTDIPLPILKLLFNRNIINQEDLDKDKYLQKVESFLKPDYKLGLNDPFLLPDMREATQRVIQALEKKEKICIYGDYDVDGVTSSALLHDIFTVLEADFDVYIPSRHDEGYGLNKKALKEIKGKGVSLVITVDCGVRSVAEAEYCKELGLDLIITDHHEIETVVSSQGQVARDLLPEAIAVINPKRQDSKYPFKELVGVGVAFKLAEGLFEDLSKQRKLEKKYGIKKDYLKWLLDFVALGTICDVAVLTDENRALVFYGLIVLSKTKRRGILALAETAGIKIEEVTSHNVGFHLGPRLNASGRLEHASRSFDLLAASSEEEAQEIAKELSVLNIKRQEVTQKILEEVRILVEEKKGDKLLLLKGKGWPKGVVGIVASRLVEECGKPVLVLEEGELESVGSARSIDGFDITEALKKCEQFLVKFGGHKKAAGLTVKNEHFILLNEKLITIANKEIREEDLIPEIEFDCPLELTDIDFPLFEYLKQMEPFGSGNKTPIFRLDNLNIADFRIIGKEGKHLKIRFEKDRKSIEGLYFSFPKGLELERKTNVDIIAALTLNEWLGRKSLELRIIDIKVAN